MLKQISILLSMHSTLASLPKLTISRNLPPSQIGLYHTDAFEQLSEKLTKQIPDGTDNLVRHMVDIMSSYCHESDDECLSRAHRSMEELQDLEFESIEEMDGFTPSMKAYMKTVQDTIMTLDTENTEDVVESLKTIQMELEETHDIDEEERRIGLVSISVAIESSTLWSNVFSNPRHPLNLLRNYESASSMEGNNNEQHRSLQLPTAAQIFGSLVVVCLIDYIGCLSAYANIFVGIAASFVAFLWILNPNLPDLTVPMFFNNINAAFFPLMPVVAPSFNVMTTNTPTASPSNVPTVKSSSLPSLILSTEPSMAPTISAQPSVLPSVQASSQPSVLPSVLPSNSPTLYPSKIPSIVPTVESSSLPSVTPSTEPSMAPTISAQPSVLPSVQASSQPSIAPSVLPSNSPTLNPSMVPSITPTVTPSVTPSFAPSMTPSITSSSMPSVKPSYRPTLAGE